MQEATPALGRPGTRSNAFDLLRLLAAFAVLAEHGWLLAGRGFPLIPPSTGITVGGVGLGVFFLTSGYLILDSWLSDPSPHRFLARRALRILPLYVVVLALAGLVLGPLLTTLPTGDYFRDPGLLDYLGSNLLFRAQEFDLPGVFAGAPYSTAVNGSLWTIPIELLCYLGILVLGVVGVVRRRWLVAVMACIPVAVFAVVSISGYTGALVPRLVSAEAAPLLAFFAIGMVVRTIRPGWKPPWALVAVAVAVWVLGWGSPVAGLAALVAVTVLTFAIAFGAPAFLHHPTGRTDLSYGIYLFAYPVQQVIVYLGVRDGWLVTLLTLVPVTALAFLSWRLVERPMLTLKPRRPRPGRHRPEAAASAVSSPAVNEGGPS